MSLSQETCFMKIFFPLKKYLMKHNFPQRLQLLLPCRVHCQFQLMILQGLILKQHSNVVKNISKPPSHLK